MGNRVPAFAFLTHFQVNTGFADKLIAVCDDHGIDLHVSHDASTYHDDVLATKNIITWGMKKNLDWYRNHGKNVLYTENGLLKQRVSMTIDTRGYFSHSSMVVSGDNHREPTADELQQLESEVKNRLERELFSGGDPAGPILVVLQLANDTPTLFEFPARKPKDDPRGTLLQLCKQYLPKGHRVVIRPHPREDFEEVRAQFESTVPSDWEWQNNTDVYSCVASSRALVTINSTIATEAIALGIPVATLGRSYFTGTNTTLDCSKEPCRLDALLQFELPKDVARCYLCSVLRNELKYRVEKETIAKHQAVKHWLNKVISTP